jgi:hypothetical protein
MDINLNATEAIEALIPITAIVMGIGIAMLGTWFDYRKKSDIAAQLHRERLAAIERGMEPPPLPPELFQRRGRTPADYLRRGLIWLFIGAGLILASLLEHHPGGWYGLIPAGIGLANLIVFATNGGRAPVPPAAR